MKVTWQAEDIKRGIQVVRNISPKGNHAIYWQVGNDIRYCLSLEDYSLSPAMTKEEMAEYLNSHGYKPAALLTL